MLNHLIAYALLALLVLGIGGIIAWNVYHSRDRTIARQRRREREYRARRSRDTGDRA